MIAVWNDGVFKRHTVHIDGHSAEIENYGAYQWRDFTHFVRIEEPEVPK